jgi:hypothetical protein
MGKVRLAGTSERLDLRDLLLQICQLVIEHSDGLAQGCEFLLVDAVGLHHRVDLMTKRGESIFLLPL